MSENKIKYHSLNGLRAISIFIVLLSHIELQYHIFPESFKFIPLIMDGQFGVNVFFVISGFLITSLLLHEQAKTGTISFRNFFIRRTLRIFPAYYFLLLVYFILQCMGYITIEKDAWITALTYTKYFNWIIDWYTAHAWSLSVEEHFYLLWPFIFLLGISMRKISAFIIVGMVPLIKFILIYYPIGRINELSIFYRIDAIVIGCICALYQKQIIQIFSPYWKYIFYGSITILCLLFFGSNINIDLSLEVELFLLLFGGTYGTIANFLIAAIMMYSIFSPLGLWYKFLNLNWINYIGVLSYSIYLWQQFFLHDTKYWVNQLPQNLILLILVSLGSYYIIEKPFFKIKDRFSSQNE